MCLLLLLCLDQVICTLSGVDQGPSFEVAGSLSPVEATTLRLAEHLSCIYFGGRVGIALGDRAPQGAAALASTALLLLLLVVNHLS